MRGQGPSGKPHDPAQYGLEMVHDVVRLLDHVGVGKAHVVGCSRGGAIALKTLVEEPERLLSVTVGGSGWFGAGPDAPLWDHVKVGDELAAGGSDTIRRALAPLGDPPPPERDIAAGSQDTVQRNDRMAQADSMRGMTPVITLTAEQLGSNRVPTLTLIGTRDPLIGDVRALVGVLSNLEVMEL